jgi:hypothetical protein
VTFAAQGFASTLQLFPVVSGRVTRKDVFLLRQSTSQLSADAGGTISLPSGVQVVVPAGALVKANGQPATGTVTVRAATIDPRNPAELLAAPGELAINGPGGRQPLVSGGMVKVDLADAQGERLDLAPGRTAEVRMPARRVTRTGTPVGEQRGDSLSAMATTLYLFNTETRQWERVDTLQFTPGDNFLASKTPTLGPWLNFDKPEMRACLVVRVQTPSGQPRAQTHVIALGVDYNGFNSGMTGDDGRAELMVLRNAIARVNAGSATTPPIPTPGAAIPCGNAGTLTF